MPNQGVMILYEVLNERPDALAERTYAVWPDLEALMREHGRAPVHRRRAPVGPRLRRASGCLVLHRARLHQHAHRARPRRHPAARGRPHRRRPDRHRRRARRVQPRAGRRLRRRRHRGRRRGGRARGHRTTSAPWKARGYAGWPARAAAAPRPHRRGLRAVALRRVLPARRADPAGRAASRRARRAVAGVEAHRHGPRRVALPQAAARAARRVGARADVGRDLPRLHPRLPVLPGRA